MNIADKVLNDKYYGKINKEKVDWVDGEGDQTSC